MRTIYINLDSRPDRRVEAEAEFARVGLSPERFPAFTNDNPCLAFNKSVYGCMELAKGDKLLLFEDDVMFDLNGNYVNPLPPEPPNFLTIHWGCNIIGTDNTKWPMPEKYSWHHAILHNCWQSHATLYSAECVQFILDNFPYHKDEYQKEGLIIFDEWLRTNVLTMGRSYVLNPMIAFQRPSVSDIWGGRFTDYTGAHKQGNLWMKNNL